MVVSDLLKVLLTGLAGVLTGILSGMFGVGGAIISTPATFGIDASSSIVSTSMTTPVREGML